ncbi:MAG: hypothetical protein GWN71_28580, partial [Gammaproteobacteria bacterium]|nr:hypothetical protein [Gemmatimonadota bacterium]NIU77364.1 hypothetical protein [Gammaproteobacteria bacterium]NIY10947.1 hypothetical protein [Gemmatimonadota bacterium]
VAGRAIVRQGGATAGVAGGDADALAVLPFAVRGGPDLAYLGEGLVDLLSTKLDGVGGIRTTDPQAVLAAVSGQDADALSTADISRASGRLDAGRVITGTVLGAGT